ncbi:MAG: CDP-glycerol glycerophosphotransferase family protein [Actinomycetota bacterium]|nr:CDP-glycerol glycerophosphotransferase family protein [Actinomycetota bacterium]
MTTAGKRRDGAVTTFTKKAARATANRLRAYGSAREPEGFDLDDVPTADIALYFADTPHKLYQLSQWLPVFEARTDMRTIVVVRYVETYNELLGRTSLKVLLVPRYEVLMALYDRADFHAVVYVNNGWTNFQSLSFQQAVHVHVNHGESDKICMVSNQAKAYDKVFVAGEAAVRRHAAALAWFDPAHLVRVGRPQLDLQVPPVVGPFDGMTITYAPTWEGEDEANNYTSVDRYGPRIVAAALAQPSARVIYKPHPRVASTKDAGVARGHAEIVDLVRSAAAADPARGHAVLLNADVLGVIRSTDLMIADVSSVSLDHLYLRPDAPLALTDRRTNRARLLEDAPVAAGAHVIDETSIGTLDQALASMVSHDSMRETRNGLRDLYFDSLAPGQSTVRFWQELERAMHEHDQALRELSRLRVVDDVAEDRR